MVMASPASRRNGLSVVSIKLSGKSLHFAQPRHCCGPVHNALVTGPVPAFNDKLSAHRIAFGGIFNKICSHATLQLAEGVTLCKSLQYAIASISAPAVTFATNGI